MKKIVCLVLLLSVICTNINILPVFAQEQCISINKTVTAKADAPASVGNPSNLVDNEVSIDDNDSYYQWNYAPWFCIDLGGYYEISGIEWISRYESTTDELEASIYGAMCDDWSDKELITESESRVLFEYDIPESKRRVYRYIIVQRPEMGCGLGGKEFYVYGKDVSERYQAEKAYDGDSETYWMCGSGEKYLQLDLNEERIISAIELSSRHDVDNIEERTNFEIWLSNDVEFNNYVVVPCVSTQTNSQRVRIGKPYGFKATYRKEIDLPDRYRYVRYVKFSGLSTISEINVLTADTEFEKQTTDDLNFKITSEFIDATGDITDKAVENSTISYTGEIINSSAKDTAISIIEAAYDKDGKMQSIDVDQTFLKKGESYDFDCCVKASNGDVKSFILEQGTIKPLFSETIAKKYVDENNSLYVSQENGNDSNNGSVLKPFKTIEKAKEAANKIKGNKDIHICIKNGYYNVKSPIEITAEDSGSENGRIIYEGYGVDETIISAGINVEGLKKGEDGIYYAEVKDADNISDLYINGQRRNIASSETLVALDEVYDTENNIYGPIVSKEQLPENIEYDMGMEIYYPSVNWRSYSLKLEKITDNDKNYILNVEKSVPVSDRSTYNLLEKFDARAFYLRNSKQLLDEEGEWYFDEELSILYYKPYAYEDMETCNVTLSGIDTIFNIKSAKHIKFDGLTFAHTGWQDAILKGEMRWQGHNQVLPVQYAMPPSAVEASYSQYIDISNCIFKNLGAVGIGFEWGMKNCNINGNIFYDIADGAMYLGNYRDIEDSKFGKNETDLTENVNVKNNVITNVGEEYHTTAALQVYAGKNIIIEHNDISDCPYTAISLGPLVWDNNLETSDENHDSGMYGFNRICNKRIHEVSKLNPDGGAIYTMGHNHGTVISGNYIKNQYMDYGAIYNDKGSACFEIYDNVLENVPGWFYEWSEEIYFIKAHNNYSTTDETYGGLFCRKSEIEDVKLYETHNKPEYVSKIIAAAGLETRFKERENIIRTPEITSPVFDETVRAIANVGENIILKANFASNDSGRYRWRVIGSNKSEVMFKDTLHGWLKKGRQFEKIYASFAKPGAYEIICEADDGRGYIYVSKQYVTVY